MDCGYGYFEGYEENSNGIFSEKGVVFRYKKF
jgi:hypothetical protein